MSLGFRDLLDLSGALFGALPGSLHLLNGVAVQRNSTTTFLVDLAFDAYDSNNGAGAPVGLEVEWSIGTLLVPGTWAPATANPYDRFHTAGRPTVELDGVPVALPAAHYNYVWNAFQDLPKGVFTTVWLRAIATDAASLQAIMTVGPIVVSTDSAGVVDPLTAQLARRAAVARTPVDYLGNGLDLPFRRGPRDFVSVSGVDIVRARVRQILSTRAAFGLLFGELPWRPDFGHKLWTIRHRGNTSEMRGRAMAFVREALRWERTIRVTEVTVERDPLPDPRKMVVRVTYEVLDENNVGSLVVLAQFTESLRISA